MEIKISIAGTDIATLSGQQYEAFTSELRVRVHEVYPQSQLLILREGDETRCIADGFHQNEHVSVVVNELLQDVLLHGYWRKLG
ncbi:DinI-like family protein [Tatumella sp. JGM130]|uniref:DinI-like family protein n=1 Tax=Tatumella sp. JGM130 TaxID=2799797 RepID=UPI001BAFF422|nr:DinI-like family protein [Tatumella sp. JGM130]MBS0895478.1 DinI-like family protein [Tatumella sp. JGM130]